MRILHLSTRLILGGSQENTVLSCEGQARLGHDVHLGFGPIYGPEGSSLGRVEAFNAAEPSHKIGIHVVPHMLRQVSPPNDAKCRRELVDLIRDLKPDIVHTHSSKAGVLGRAAAWDVFRRDKRPIGIVHTIHGPPFMPVEGSPLRRLKIRLINQLYTLAERHAARQCHLIVSVADAMTAQFLARRIGAPRQYVTVYSGMEVDRYLHAAPGEDRASVRRELGLTDDNFVVGTVARLAEHKGHDDLLDALADRLRANPRWKLLWIGDGWWRPRLEKRLVDEGLRSSVIITGLVPSERVAAMMRAMDVLAHPSYREGLPRTVPQGLLCAVPVIAHDVDGTSEACLDPSRVGPDRATGLLVRPGDRDRLRNAVEWMAEHPAERAAMAQRGRELCRVRFSTATMVRDLEGVYARALELATSS
jgi:glycosyltransferase involved in cell wall biosynthesis